MACDRAKCDRWPFTEAIWLTVGLLLGILIGFGIADREAWDTRTRKNVVTPGPGVETRGGRY